MAIQSGMRLTPGRFNVLAGSAGLTGTLMTLTTSLADCPGCLVTLTTTTPDAIAVVTFSADFQLVTAGAGTGIVLVSIDGTDQSSPQCLANFSNITAGGRMVAGNSLTVGLPAVGAHSFRLRAQVSGATGLRLNGLHTQISVLIHP